MKKKGFVLVVAFLVGVSSLVLPVTTYAGHGGGWGWGAFAGGLLLGTALTAPWYYAPRPVYVYPPPPVVYTYPAPAPVYVPGQAYAYPDPAYARSYSQAPAPAPTSTQAPAGGQGSGQWVQVPGQWVGDKWVPPHRAWAPTGQ